MSEGWRFLRPANPEGRGRGCRRFWASFSLCLRQERQKAKCESGGRGSSTLMIRGSRYTSHPEIFMWMCWGASLRGGRNIRNHQNSLDDRRYTPLLTQFMNPHHVLVRFSITDHSTRIGMRLSVSVWGEAKVKKYAVRNSRRDFIQLFSGFVSFRRRTLDQDLNNITKITFFGNYI